MRFWDGTSNNIEDSPTFVFGELEDTDGMHRPPLEGRSAHPISVLSVRWQANAAVYADARLHITMHHNDK